MFDSLANWVEPLLLLLVALVLISGYFRMQEHTVDAREQSKIQKAEIYANAKIASARIQANAEYGGFHESDQESGMDLSSLLPLLNGGSIEDFVKTPEGLQMAQSFLKGQDSKSKET